LFAVTTAALHLQAGLFACVVTFHGLIIHNLGRPENQAEVLRLIGDEGGGGRLYA
jgi:hypothetical protein